MTDRSLFQAPNQPAAAASANQSTPVQPAPGESPESVDSSMHPNNLFGHKTVPEATAPCASFEFVELNEPACSAEQLGSIVIDAMLSGTNLIPHHSSDQVFDEAISQASVPKAVAEQKKNRCTSVDSLVAHFKVAEPHYVFPTGEDCDELRLCMTKVITQIRKDYKCSANLEFTAQLICGILGLADKSLKLKTQFRRFLFCQNKTDMKSFADCCAMGKAFPAKIDHAIPVAQLPGYQILMDDATEWIQLATALLDYMCFMSNSVVQASYHITKTAIKTINPASFASMQEFADAEESAYNKHSSAAQAAQRSLLDEVDRGMIILINLPPSIRTRMNKNARKQKVPENCQTRDWVILQLLDLEEFNDPDFSWYIAQWRSKKVCRQFLSGNCSFTDCKFSHDKSNTPIPPDANSKNDSQSQSALSVAAGSLRNDDRSHHPAEDLSADDVVDIKCSLHLSPECTENFKASPSYWTAIKDDHGKPYSVPKSCKACRTAKKLTASASLLTADDIRINEQLASLMATDPHEDEVADDDYSAYAAYDLSISDV